MRSSYDTWKTKSGPDFTPTEICLNEWTNDLDFWDQVAPFDETRCSAKNCNQIIGAHLYQDPLTTADFPTFASFWVMDEDYEILFCEDCWIEATTEVE